MRGSRAERGATRRGAGGGGAGARACERACEGSGDSNYRRSISSIASGINEILAFANRRTCSSQTTASQTSSISPNPNTTTVPPIPGSRKRRLVGSGSVMLTRLLSILATMRQLEAKKRAASIH